MTAMTERRLTGKHVLLGLIGFFGVIFVVNGMMAYYALHSWTGLVDARSYEDGLAYNRVLKEAAEQKAMGWQSKVAITQAADAKGLRTATVRMQGAGGEPLTGLDVEMTFRRPTHEGMDQTLTAKETEPGVYAVAVDLPARGRWDVDLRVHAGNDRQYRMMHVLYLKP